MHNRDLSRDVLSFSKLIYSKECLLFKFASLISTKLQLIILWLMSGFQKVPHNKELEQISLYITTVLKHSKLKPVKVRLDWTQSNQNFLSSTACERLQPVATFASSCATSLACRL